MVWLNVLVQGILIGGFYALFACGLSLMFGVLKVITSPTATWRCSGLRRGVS